jgi:hypothetical protein
MRRRLAHQAALVAAGLTLTVVQHWVTVGYGFYYDDYHFIHPYGAPEVLAAFHGPWDASGIETAYYRPLTICLYAARFYFLGLNSAAYHVLTLAMFAAAAAGLGLFVLRATSSFAAGLLATAVLVVHPGMPYSAVAWITNQMHVAETLVILAALGWWFAVRRRPAVWWTPLIALQLAVLMIKEDGIMLLPAVVSLHLLRRWLVERDLPGVPVAFLGAAVLAGGALLFVRQAALQGAAHTRLPSLEQAQYNVGRGLSAAFRLLPARRPLQSEASWFVLLVPLAALAAWKRIPPPVRFVFLAGAVVGVLFDLPFIFIVKAEQLHLVSLGASLCLAGAAAGLLEAARPSRLAQAVVAAVLVCGISLLAAVSRNITRDFEPFSAPVLATDRHAEGWAAVPLELREYLARKRLGDTASVDPNPSHQLPLVGFGLHGVEIDPHGVGVRWMSQAAADLYVRRDLRLITIPLRHEIGAFREPARVHVIADGRVATELVLSDDAWHPVTVALSPRAVPRLGGMHRVQIRIDRAWVPAQMIPGSTDTRTLGLQVGPIALR